MKDTVEPYVTPDGRTIGEVVFNTAMTGYQEILTSSFMDPGALDAMELAEDDPQAVGGGPVSLQGNNDLRGVVARSAAPGGSRRGEVVGELPFDTVVTEAMVHGQPVTAYQPDGAMAAALRRAWTRVLAWLGE